MSVPEIEIPYDGWLTTLEEVRLKQNTLEEDTNEPIYKADDLLRFCIRQASSQIIAYLGWLPIPYRAERRYTKSAHSKLADVLVHPDLLEIDSLTDANDAAVSNYELLPENGFPKRKITFDAATCAWLSQGCPPSRRRYTVTGWWGYVPHYPRAWKPSGVVLDTGGITADAVELGVAAEQITLFETGDYMRLEDEMLWITNIDTGANKLSFERGTNGTTAVEHAAGVSIQLFEQLDVIRTQASDWATYLFKTLPQIGSVVQIMADGSQIVNGLSPLVKEALQKHQYKG